MKQNELIKLIKAMNAHELRMWHSWEKLGNEQMAHDCLHRSMSYDEFIWLLTDKSYADKMKSIFADEMKGIK